MLDLIGNPRLLTVSVAVICILIFITQLGGGIGGVCLYPARIVSRFEIYRLVTFPYFHAGFIHILFNMIAWIYLGKEFERMMGTLGAAYSILVLFVPLSAILHCTAAFLLDALAGTRFRYECAIGISGVLFSILVFNLQMSGTTSVSFFGMINIPSRWYPWILALLLQLISSRLSLLGHLSGIVLGYALAYGWLSNFSPSEFKLQDIEENMGFISWPLWQSVPSAMGISFGGGGNLPQTSNSDRPFAERFQSAWEGLKSWFSWGNSSGSSNEPFTGEGRTLGGGSPRAPGGRVPPTSRLLQESNKPRPAVENGGPSTAETSETRADKAPDDGPSLTTEPV